MPEIDDISLWQTYRNGDQKALGQLAERYYRDLRRYGLKFMVGESVVDDCLQELFCQLWQNRQTINITLSVKHYLFKALRHHILQYLRYQKRFTPNEPDWDTALPQVIDAQSLLIEQETLDELMNQLHGQLNELPKREREALYLRYFENLSIPEIADVMQVNRQSVSNFLQKALDKLRNRWVVGLALVVGLTVAF